MWPHRAWAAHQAPPFLGFSRQEPWSGLPFPYPMHESEKWKWSHSVMSDSSWPHGLPPTRLLRPWDFPGKSTGVGCHALLQGVYPTQGSNSCLLQLLHCRWIPYCWATREALTPEGVEYKPPALYCCSLRATCQILLPQITVTQKREPSGTLPACPESIS